MDQLIVVLDSDAAAIGDLYQRAKGSIVESVSYLIEAGRRLIQKKDDLAHGEFLPWLTANANVLGFSDRSTARRLMQGAKWGAGAPFDEQKASELSRAIWGHSHQRTPLIESREPLSDGCKVEDLNDLITSGKRFPVIYADPPWEFKVYSGKGKKRSAERYYETDSIDEICDLPVEQLAAEDCALFLWCVSPELPGALKVIEAWGFKYKTVAFAWVKQTKGDNGLHWGMGYWTRANVELCLLATKGSPQRQAKDVHQVVMKPVSEHSRKPDEVQVRIERLLSGPYLELYARRPTEGWTVWGNQISSNLFQQSIPEFVA